LSYTTGCQGELMSTGNMDDTIGFIDQGEIDNLLAIAEFIDTKNDNQNSLIEEVKSAILDSGKLRLKDWHTLRKCLCEIEDLIPHIDLIIKLKEQRRDIERMDSQSK